jgi:ATP-dependent DNA helicase PIF1
MSLPLLPSSAPAAPAAPAALIKELSATMPIKELSLEQNEAMKAYTDGKNIFLTGPGGSGKTELIKRMVAFSRSQGKKVQVCALTGCAAVLLNCNAKTIHSWAGIGIASGLNEDIVQKIKMNKYKKKNWQSIDILIIDEISMMSLKVFDLLDAIGKCVRSAPKPFGGLQLVLSGDFYQLPPVGNTSETNAFCFESLNWNSTFQSIIQLKTIFRQTDPVYTKILNQVRVGKLYKSSLDCLNAQVNKPLTADFKPTILFPRRKDADLINYSELEKIPGEGKIYKRTRAKESDLVSLAQNNNNKWKSKKGSGDDRGTDEMNLDIEYNFLVNNIMADEELVLKVGAQVMCIVNIDNALDATDSAIKPDMIVNGSQGIVIDFIRDLPIVQFNNGVKRVIGHHVWASEVYSSVGVKQIPLIHAWAITIHKSQGVTLEMAQIDAGSNIFECGQTYVALSRVKSLDGLYLTALNPQKIRVNKKVQDFYSAL